MPTKRTRLAHTSQNNLSNAAAYYASDGLWGTDPESDFCLDILTYKYPTVYPDQCRQVWQAIRDELLQQWIKMYPGTRPTWWFLFDADCPRISAEDVKRHGWEGWFFLELLPDFRKRLRGSGDPDFEHWNVVPRLRCAVPAHFVTEGELADTDEYEDFDGKLFDSEDPPIYESQATYLNRHGLLTTAEKRELKPKDFKPEKLSPAH